VLGELEHAPVEILGHGRQAALLCILDARPLAETALEDVNLLAEQIDEVIELLVDGAGTGEDQHGLVVVGEGVALSHRRTLKIRNLGERNKLSRNGERHAGVMITLGAVVPVLDRPVFGTHIDQSVGANADVGVDGMRRIFDHRWRAAEPDAECLTKHVWD